jgi:hypothetical protein
MKVGVEKELQLLSKTMKKKSKLNVIIAAKYKLLNLKNNI